MTNPSAKHKHDRLVEFVKQIMEAKQQEADTVNEAKRDFWARKAAGLDRQIDALVYELYGLTAEEVALVEGRSLAMNEAAIAEEVHADE